MVDWCHNITSLDMAERVVDGLIDSGIRAVFAHGDGETADQGRRGAFHACFLSARAHRSVAQRLLTSDDNLVTLAMAILGLDWGAWEVVEQDIRTGREPGLALSSTHAAARGLRGAGWLSSHGESWSARSRP